MAKKYIVRLSGKERDFLEGFVRKGKAAAYKIKHANILLKADAERAGWVDTRIADALGLHPGRTIRSCFRNNSYDKKSPYIWLRWGILGVKWGR